MEQFLADKWGDTSSVAEEIGERGRDLATRHGRERLPDAGIWEKGGR